jgi:hypothetical protein
MADPFGALGSVGDHEVGHFETCDERARMAIVCAENEVAQLGSTNMVLVPSGMTARGLCHGACIHGASAGFKQ